MQSYLRNFSKSFWLEKFIYICKGKVYSESFSERVFESLPGVDERTFSRFLPNLLTNAV